MELALELGSPVEQLSRQMTEREFGWWAKRSATQWLPSRRIEWYLAQIAALIATTMGGAKDVTVSDFMLHLEPQTEPQVANVVDIRAAFGFAPRRKKAA